MRELPGASEHQRLHALLPHKRVKAERIDCPTHGVQPVTHIYQCNEGELGCALEYAEYMLHKNAPREGVHVTDALGCPKSKGFANETDAIFQLDRGHNTTFGTMGHSEFEKIRSKSAEIPVRLDIFGLTLLGTVDRIRMEKLSLAHNQPVVVDYKTGNAISFKKWKLNAKFSGYNKEAGTVNMDPGHKWQTNGYRRALDQAGTKTVGQRVLYGANTDTGCPKWVSSSSFGPIPSEEEMGDYRPHDGIFTTRQIAELAAEVAEGMPVESVPLVGESMKMGRGSTCDFCSFQKSCQGMDYEGDSL